MGLEAVEIVIAVEEEFDIAIEDDEASAVRTPNDLFDLIATKVKSSHRSGCRSQKAFGIVRRRITEMTGVARSSVRPDCELEPLLAGGDIQAFWTSLNINLGDRALPRLDLPPFLDVLLFSAVIASGSSASIAMGIATSNAFLLFCAFFLAGGLVGWLFDRATSNLRRIPPRGTKTVGELCSQLVARTPRLFLNEAGWGDREIRETTRAIIGTVLGISDFPDDADFVQDLGVG